MLLLLLLCCVLILVLYKKIQNSFKYWEHKNVPNVEPLPFLEQFGFSRKRPLTEIMHRVYNTYKDKRYVGSYFFSKPTFVIRDPDLIKEITIKSFDHFVDHRPFIRDDVDNLWSKNLLASTGDTWRNLRHILSPSFTGNKMRYLFTILEECSKDFILFLNNQNKDQIELELKDTFGKYTNDVIASSAFGLKCNSLENPTNDFYLNGLKISNVFISWRFLLHSMFPLIGKLIKLRLFPQSLDDFFPTIVKTTIKERKEKNIVRPDLLQLLMQASNNSSTDNENDENKIATSKTTKSTTLSMEEISAQAFIFFLAGFDTISTGLSFVVYELAVNQDVQQKLYEEIKFIVEENADTLNYETLKKMKYLDMVVSESLRKWPPFPLVDRVVTKRFEVEPKTLEETTVVLEEGDVVWIPIFGIHMDPKYFPNPEKFDPERFSDENKDKMVPFTYMPFGNGPRNCIGSRFALLEMKLLVFHLIRSFQVIPTEKSQIPVVVDPDVGTLGAKSLHFALKKRKN